MQTSTDLKNLLKRIDHKGYPAYKDTKGMYQFPGYVLSIDHVQGDPFASPSKVSVHVKGAAAGFPKELYCGDCQRIALQDDLTRRFGMLAGKHAFQAKGSGKSGLISVSRCGQEVLERTACRIDEKSGDVVLRMEIGFPANGRTINARELEKILFDYVPECVENALFYKKRDAKKLASGDRSGGGSGLYPGTVERTGTRRICGKWFDPPGENPACRQNRCAARSRLFLRKRWK